MRLGRFVTIDNLSSNRSTNRRPSVNDDTMEAGNAEAIAVLLSKNVLHEPLALIELYQAPPLIFARYSLLTACYCTHYSHLAHAHIICACLTDLQAARTAKVIVPICLWGRGYDFKEASNHLGNLESKLSAPKLAELEQRLENLSSAPTAACRSVAGLQAVLLATLPRIIAVNWEPEGGKNQLLATVTNVLARLNTHASTPQVKASVTAMREAIRLVRAAESFQAERSDPSEVGVDVISVAVVPGGTRSSSPTPLRPAAIAEHIATAAAEPSATVAEPSATVAEPSTATIAEPSAAVARPAAAVRTAAVSVGAAFAVRRGPSCKALARARTCTSSSRASDLERGDSCELGARI